MRRPKPVELRFARELAEVALAAAALEVLHDVLVHEHPSALDLAEVDPPSVRAARRLLHAVQILRVELRRYRARALVHVELAADPLPF